MTTCAICELVANAPELVVAEKSRWLLIGFTQRFTPGTLLLVPRDHHKTTEIDAGLWTAAAPLLARGMQLVHQVGGAQKVYLAAFGEQIEHFHLVLLGKSERDEANHDGKRAAALFEAIAEAGPPDRADVLAQVERYRADVKSRGV